MSDHDDAQVTRYEIVGGGLALNWAVFLVGALATVLIVALMCGGTY
jgi:hypothetical protein